MPASILDDMRLGIIICDDSRRVVFTNALGKVLMAEQTLLWLGPAGDLRTVSPEDQNKLSAVIRAGGRRAPIGTALKLDRGGATALVWAIPYRRQTELAIRNGHVVLLVQPPGDVPQIDPTAIEIAFGLTTAEARVAAALVAGITIAHYAGQAGLAEKTVRNQLASVYTKLGVRRQAELVVLILRRLGPLSAWLPSSSVNI